MLKHYTAEEPLSTDCDDLAPSAPLCLFFCTASGFPKENVISVVEPKEGSTFSRCHKSITEILPYGAQVFLCSALKEREAHTSVFGGRGDD